MCMMKFSNNKSRFLYLSQYSVVDLNFQIIASDNAWAERPVFNATSCNGSAT